MKQRTSFLLLSAGVVAALFGASTALAQSTRTTAKTISPTSMATSMPGCTLWLDGVQGENATGSIEVQSFSWGMSNATSVGSSGMGAGKVSMSDISFMVTKRIDKTSPQLFLNAVSGTHMKSAKLSCKNSSGQEYYQVTLADVMVSSLMTQSGSDRPMESLSLNFTKIEFSYSPQKSDGSLDTAIKATYDLKAAKK